MGKAVSVGMLTYMIRRSYPELRVTFTRDLDLNWISLVMRVGLPVLTLESLDGFAFLMQLRIVNTLGVVAATAYALGFIIVDVVDSTLRGLSSAVAVMIGQNLGAGNYERAREIAYKSALLIFTTLALGATCVYPVRSTLVRAFVEEPSIIAETSLFLETLLPTLPFFGLFAVARSVGRGSGYTLPPTSIGMFRLWGMRVALGYILAFTLGMGSLGAWLAIGLGNIVSGVASTLWMKHGKWAKALVEKNTSR
jgi:Na+-driven multidrug efflux pump